MLIDKLSNAKKCSAMLHNPQQCSIIFQKRGAIDSGLSQGYFRSEHGLQGHTVNASR